MLSDQSENLSRVANGPLAGMTLRQMLAERQSEILGETAASSGPFPLLLKFLDARQNLSVQVHPDDAKARELEPASAGLGKTEAWVILKSEPGSRIYAGLRKGVGRREFHDALKRGSLPDVMHSYEPKVGDCVFLEAGTVHAIGAGLMLFEIQQTSDITYRLYDWGRVDAKTGKSRPLHIEQALACTNYELGPCDPVQPQTSESSTHEQLVTCPYFAIKRISETMPFAVGRPNECRIVVCLDGGGIFISNGRSESLRPGSIRLIPGSVGVCEIVPNTTITVLECDIRSARPAIRTDLVTPGSWTH